jgi:hypothetical protein
MSDGIDRSLDVDVLNFRKRARRALADMMPVDKGKGELREAYGLVEALWIELKRLRIIEMAERTEGD